MKTILLPFHDEDAGRPDGYGYSRFCALDGAWRRTISATMRQTHVADQSKRSPITTAGVA